jgi:hypothetical protein
MERIALTCLKIIALLCNKKDKSIVDDSEQLETMKEER